MSAIKELAAAVLLQATKDYFDETDKAREAILNDLRSDWLEFLTDGMSVIVAEQITLHPEEIIIRLRKEETSNA